MIVVLLLYSIQCQYIETRKWNTVEKTDVSEATEQVKSNELSINSLNKEL